MDHPDMNHCHKDAKVSYKTCASGTSTDYGNYDGNYENALVDTQLSDLMSGMIISSPDKNNKNNTLSSKMTAEQGSLSPSKVLYKECKNIKSSEKITSTDHIRVHKSKEMSHGISSLGSGICGLENGEYSLQPTSPGEYTIKVDAKCDSDKTPVHAGKVTDRNLITDSHLFNLLGDASLLISGKPDHGKHMQEAESGGYSKYPDSPNTSPYQENSGKKMSTHPSYTPINHRANSQLGADGKFSHIPEDRYAKLYDQSEIIAGNLKGIMTNAENDHMSTHNRNHDEISDEYHGSVSDQKASVRGALGYSKTTGCHIIDNNTCAAENKSEYHQGGAYIQSLPSSNDYVYVKERNVNHNKEDSMVLPKGRILEFSPTTIVSSHIQDLKDTDKDVQRFSDNLPKHEDDSMRERGVTVTDLDLYMQRKARNSIAEYIDGRLLRDTVSTERKQHLEQFLTQIETDLDTVDVRQYEGDAQANSSSRTTGCHLSPDSNHAPSSVPVALSVEHDKVFEGQTLLQWLSSAFSDSCTLHQALSHSDINVLLSQICTYLMAAGVIGRLESGRDVFTPNDLYVWMPNRGAEIGFDNRPGKLTPHWPPPESVETDPANKPGLKYTEAAPIYPGQNDHQAAMVACRRHYKEELNTLQLEHKSLLSKVHEEYGRRLDLYDEDIHSLQREISRYEVLLGLDDMTRTALMEAAAADRELGYGSQRYVIDGKFVPLSQQIGKISDNLKTFRENGFVVISEGDRVITSVLKECDNVEKVERSGISEGNRVATTASSASSLKQQNRDIGGTVIPTRPAAIDITVSPSSPPPPQPAAAYLAGPQPPVGPPPSVESPPLPAVPPLPVGPPLPAGPPLLAGPPPPPPPPLFPNAPPPPPLPPAIPAVPGLPQPPGIPPLPGMPLPRFNTAPKLTKPQIMPKSPMKPLFWSRLTIDKHSGGDKGKLWSDLEELKINEDEFSELFGKSASSHDTKSNHFTKKAPTKQVAKILEPRRSQQIGIVLSSLRMDVKDLETAIFNLDSTVLTLDKLQSIYDARPEAEELKKIQQHLDSSKIQLDKPEQFLLDITAIPHCMDLIYCFMFQSSFPEHIESAAMKIHNLITIIDDFMTNHAIRHILAIILTLGNYMNGGNKQRGQADGFSLDILPKLKDVKSRDNRSSLLHYIVSQYIAKFEKDIAGTDRAKFPLPEYTDIYQAALVKFDDVDAELMRINNEFQLCERTARTVMNDLDPARCKTFTMVMNQFFLTGKHDLMEQDETTDQAKMRFNELVAFFSVVPKTGEKFVTPEYFFSTWAPFCKDFRDIWRKEQQKIAKQRAKESKEKVKAIQQQKSNSAGASRVKKVGGLKDRLANKGLI